MTGASKRGLSAINVLGNSHSCLFTNCTAGSNPEMFPPQLREPVKHMADAFPTGFWMHGFQRHCGERKLCLVLVAALAGFMRMMRNRGRERWTGWLEPGSGAPTAGHVPLPVSLSHSSTMCLVHLTQPCSKLTLLRLDSSSALHFLVPYLCPQVFISLETG